MRVKSEFGLVPPPREHTLGTFNFIGFFRVSERLVMKDVETFEIEDIFTFFFFSSDFSTLEALEHSGADTRLDRKKNSWPFFHHRFNDFSDFSNHANTASSLYRKKI